MDKIQCSCYCCGNQCKDWNAYAVSNLHPYKCICSSCAEEVTGCDLPDGNGYAHRPEHPTMQKIEALKIKYQGFITISLTLPSYPEKSCQVCDRKNDVGNPQVKVCWNCGNSLT